MNAIRDLSSPSPTIAMYSSTSLNSLPNWSFTRPKFFSWKPSWSLNAYRSKLSLLFLLDILEVKLPMQHLLVLRHVFRIDVLQIPLDVSPVSVRQIPHINNSLNGILLVQVLHAPLLRFCHALLPVHFLEEVLPRAPGHHVEVDIFLGLLSLF